MNAFLLDYTQVLERVRRGEVDAFAEVVASFEAPIRLYLYHLTGDHELARDLAQDTFVRTYEAILKTEINISLKGYLYRVAHNTAVQQCRRGKNVSFVSLGTARSEDTPAPAPDAAEAMAVREALLRIPEKLRTCVVLHHVDGFKYREIADVLGISEDAVRMRVARGSEEFRRHYRSAEDGVK
jgi:RNA polymerase sigma-70 factor, ECF subfamily